MRARGITYDTGSLPGREISRKSFTSKAVRHDMAVIYKELPCDAVRVSGKTVWAVVGTAPDGRPGVLRQEPSGPRSPARRGASRA
ncbi:hypothetical protein SUDANB176_06359 [Streptomyces sp. enrichment culture]|uniref:hypothetical protein n=1 Tax=Streptomyces sp. enrichment culture TaxID=1795815 RepID=UPI003F55B8DF